MIIALTGEKLSGKGTTAQYLAEHYQATVYRFSKILSDILERLYQANSRANLVTLGTAVRTAFGDDILAQVLFRDIERNRSDHLVVIDGLRYIDEWNIVAQLPNIHLWYIVAPLELRYHRLQQRTEKVDERSMTWDEFKRREQDVTEQGITALRPLARYHIDNTGSFTDLYNQIDQAVKQ
ncbi:MAG: AAA family ATPase [Candidatus Kerfeldbacteria bacterium]|nr:AAA family ATPase [Candidatus Kerfeldbacteria bacterium]